VIQEKIGVYMHLQRVQVPDFRVLKDVDITFEKDFNPRIFPLGSQNGGGKSTLLQLIFVLLHCSASPDRHLAIQNLLWDFHLRDGEEERKLAIIDVWNGEILVQLEFFICEDSYVSKKLIPDDPTEQHQESNNLTFSLFDDIKNTKTKINKLSKDMDRVSIILKELHRYYNHRTNEEVIPKGLFRLRDDIRSFGIEISDFLPEDPQLLLVIYKEVIVSVEEKHSVYVRQIDVLKDFLEVSARLLDKLMQILKANNVDFVLKFNTKNSVNETKSLLCKTNSLDNKQARDVLKDISNKVFLAAPSTQVFLFLSQETRKLLFAEKGHGFVKHTNYLQQLKGANTSLSGLFTYDFLAVDLLIESFKTAIDKDCRQAIETGEYGNNYKALLNDLDALLNNKRVNLKPDFSALTFTTNLPNDDIELYPEDLSHGELKRLSIYMWLKHRNIEDAIVLMDEVDLALHPDWQYKLVSDLLDWVPSNQYILATHSYELCNALTPTHVKVLEPKLTERRSD
jgi:predicted ATP-dependent endonuclease of OLD family